MADYDIIKKISSEIVSLLKCAMPQADSIGLVDSLTNAGYLINIFLYDIVGLDRTLYDVHDDTTVLVLKYIVLIKSKGEAHQKPYDEHMLLGKVVQIINDNRMILHGNIEEGGASYSLIELDNIGVDEKLRIKSEMKGQPPVLFYKVQPVFIETGNPATPAVKVKEAKFELRGVK